MIVSGEPVWVLFLTGLLSGLIYLGIKQGRSRLALLIPLAIFWMIGAAAFGLRETRLRDGTLGLDYRWPTSWSRFSLQLSGALQFSVMYAVCYCCVAAIRRRLSPGSAAAVNRTVCEKCGYSLVGLPTPRCPECGTEFDEKLWRQIRGRRFVERQISIDTCRTETGTDRVPRQRHHGA